jgi:hypothetical protein
MREEIKTQTTCWQDRDGLKWSVRYADFAGRWIGEKHFETRLQAEAFVRGLKNG